MFAASTGLRQLSFQGLTACHVLKRIRELEQRWICLFRSESDLLIFREDDLLHPFFSNDSVLCRVLARWVTEDRQNVLRHPQPGSIFSVLAGETARIGRVNIGADNATLKIAGMGSNWSPAVVEGSHISSKESEPVSVGEKFSITRAEARDHFNKIADHAGARWAWDKHLVANSKSSKTPERNLSRAPSPGLRRLWIEASTAGRVMDQLRTLEAECALLFGANAEQPIFSEDGVVRPLVEFLGIDETLIRVIAPAVTDDCQNLERPPKSSAPPQHLSAKPPDVKKANNPAPLPPLHKENDAAAEAGNKVVDRRSSVTWTRLSVTARKEPQPAPAPVPNDITISRAQARVHFDEIVDHAGLHSAWKERAITTSDTQPTLYIPDRPPKAAALAQPPVSNSKRAINDAGVDYQDPTFFMFPSALGSSHASLADARARSSVAYPNATRIVQSESTTNHQRAGPVRWEQVARPLLETIQTSHRLALRKPAYAGTRVGPHRRSERDDPSPVSEVPMTGLRRLAEMAVNSDGPSNNTDRQNIFGDRRITSGAPNPLPGSQVAIGDETDFASQLAEHLRSEVLRHGIRVENN
jgi:hypothetical protein